jgi:F-type H+-transporting ATPase subunit gamma
MAKARAIVKRRKAVRNIRKITKTMQMIATAKFQKSLKRAVGTKPYTLKIRELVTDLAASVGDIDHPLLRRPGAIGPDGQPTPITNRIALIVITSNRGLAGAYNGGVLRSTMHFIRQQEAAGKHIDLYVSGKKGASYFNFQKRPIVQRIDLAGDVPRFADIEPIANNFMSKFIGGKVDSVHVSYMNFISTSTQRPEVLTLLPLAGVAAAVEHIALQVAEKEAQAKAGALDARRTGGDVSIALPERTEAEKQVIYDFSPAPRELLDELLPLTVKTALFQCFLDAATSENVARMVAMKSATDNADKMVKSLTMQYNRARQSQITTELSEIMGGVEAMKGKG